MLNNVKYKRQFDSRVICFQHHIPSQHALRPAGDIEVRAPQVGGEVASFLEEFES